jgi:O-antigen/teichoic acid export membrane protein
MPAEKTIAAPTVSEASHKLAFFRQSGWMMIATVLCGVFAAGIHVFSKFIDKAEYATVGALIQLINCMMIPGLGLQMVLAHQASSAVTADQRQRLVGTFKAVMRWTFYLWLAMVAIVFVFRSALLASLEVANPAALWWSLLAAFAMLWLPIFNGLLQWRQNFLWMGWVAIVNGAGRLVFAGVIVAVVAGSAVGIMAGIFLGIASAVALGMWQNADLLREPGAAFDARGWLRHVVPLTLGCGVGQFLFSADPLVVKSYLGGDGHGTLASPYFFGRTLAQSVVLLTAPLAAVMFPKLVQSKAKSEQGGGQVFVLTLFGTAALGAIGALLLPLVAPLLIKYGSNPDYVSFVPLLGLMTWAMVPLAVGNVLLNNLMAHSRFKVVPALVLLAAGYWFALQHFHESFKMVIATFGIFNLVYLAVCAAFTWWPADKDLLKPVAP